MSSFETQRRLTVVNACANVVDFAGGREALTARAPSPPCALVQPPGLPSSVGPWPPGSTSRAAPMVGTAVGAAGTLHVQQTQSGPYLRDKLAPRDVFRALVKCSSVCRGKSLSPVPFQWSGSVCMLMAVAAGIPELLQRDCSLHFHAGKEEFC